MNRLPDDPRLPPHARGSMFAAALLIAFSVASFGWSSYKVYGVSAPVWVTLAHVIVALLVAWAALRMGRLTLPRVVVSELLLITPMYYEVWSRHAWLMELGTQFTPFQGLKLIVIGLAVVVPAPVWLHMIWLAGFGVLSAVVWYRIELAGLPTAYLADEPWFTVMFFVTGLGLLVYRWHSQNLAHKLMAAEARSRAIAGVARLFLRMRDETNTPLQNLRLGLELGAQRHPEETDLLGKMRAALDRIEASRGVLSRYDHLISWDGSELRADPEFEALLAELEHEAKNER